MNVQFPWMNNWTVLLEDFANSLKLLLSGLVVAYVVGLPNIYYHKSLGNEVPKTLKKYICMMIRCEIISYYYQNFEVCTYTMFAVFYFCLWN